MKTLEFVIRPKWDQAATKEGKKLTTEQRKQNEQLTVQKQKFEQLRRESLNYLRTTEDGFVKLGRAMRKSSDETRAAFAAGPLVGISKMQRGLEGVIGKVFTLKNVLLGTALGAGAYFGARKLFGAGANDLQAQARLKREFGGDAAAMQGVANLVGRNAGLSNAEALKSLFTIGEAVSGTQEGVAFRGKRLNAADAATVRKKTFEFGAKLLSRAVTVTGATGEEAEQLAYVLANAGTGPEGMRGLVSNLHLNRALSAEILKANAKNKLYDFLGKDASAKFGVEKGKQAGQGTIIDILMQRSGITDEAADAARKKFGFQLKSIGATFEDVMGRIGGAALDKVNGGFSKGGTLAEKFQNAIESPKGAEMIKKIGDGLGSMVESAVKLATKIPEAFGWFERNKTLLATIGIVYGGTRLVSGIGATFAGMNTPSAGGLNSLLSGGRGMPVYVTNPGFGGGPGGATLGQKLGAATGALAVGYGVGSYLENKFKLSDKIYAGSAEGVKDRLREEVGVQTHRGRLAAIGAERASKIAALEAEGLSHGQAIAAVEHGSSFDVQSGDTTRHIYLQLDGKVVAEVVDKHQQRKARNRTANGAAP